MPLPGTPRCNVCLDCFVATLLANVFLTVTQHDGVQLCSWQPPVEPDKYRSYLHLRMFLIFLSPSLTFLIQPVPMRFSEQNPACISNFCNAACPSHFKTSENISTGIALMFCPWWVWRPLHLSLAKCDMQERHLCRLCSVLCVMLQSVSGTVQSGL